MKKFVAILVAAIMLVSLVPTSFAAPTTDYYADMIGTFTGNKLYNSAGAYTQYEMVQNVNRTEDYCTGFIAAGDLSARKNADDTMMVNQVYSDTKNNSNWFGGILRSVPLTYSAGEKAYMRAQWYIPSTNTYGDSLINYNDELVVRMTAAVEGITETNVIGFARTGTTGGEIRFRNDAGLVADQTWAYDTWYTIEAVVTFGNPAKLSVYVDGQPLTFTDKAIANSVDVSLGAAGTKITEHRPIYMLTKWKMNPTLSRQVFSDNWAYESYEADEPVSLWTPPVYNPISFDGFTNGSKLDIETFTQATVTVGREICTEVSLFIDGESLGTLTEAPYTFNIPSSIELGNATIKAIAKTETETFERSVNIILTEIYARKAMDQNMDAYGTFTDVANGGWYSPSSRFSLSGLVPNGWFMNPEVVQDKAKKSFGKAVKFGCNPESGEKYIAQSDYSYDYIDFGYTGFNATGGSISGYTADLNFQMYMDNGMLNTNKTDAFTLTTGQELFRWDHTEQKLKWNVKGDPVYTPVKYQYWQNYAVELDMSGTTTKMSLSIDGEKIFEDRELASIISNFNIIKWHYAPNPVTGNFVAIDEVLLMHYTPRPGFGEATFYRGETENIDLDNISSLTDTITINMGKDLMPNMLNEYVKFYENGKELTFTDDDGVINKTSVLLYNGLLYLVPPCPLLSDTEYSVFLDKDALFADGVKIGYDQTFTFKTAKADLDVVDVTYYKNGTAVENLDAVTFVAGDKIKAEITVCNANILDEDVYVMLLGYNGKLLTASDITLATAVAEKADNVFETAEITVADATDFSVSAAVWNGDFLPIANATIASGNQ